MAETQVFQEAVQLSTVHGAPGAACAVTGVCHLTSILVVQELVHNLGQAQEHYLCHMFIQSNEYKHSETSAEQKWYTEAGT